MGRLMEDSPLSDEEISDYIDAWLRRRHLIETHSNTINKQFEDLDSNELKHLQHYLYDDIYKNLDTLDTKTGSLVQAASVVMGVLLLIAQSHLSSGVIPLPVFLGIISSILSVFLCISVVHVVWSKTVQLKKNYEIALRDILRIKNGRTWRYRLAYYLLLITVFMLVWYATRFVPNVELSFR